MTEVKDAQERRQRGRCRVSSKNQVTIPVDALRNAGLQPGDHVIARVDGPGRVILEREEDVVERYAGVLTGLYDPSYLADLRAEWD